MDAGNIHLRVTDALPGYFREAEGAPNQHQGQQTHHGDPLALHSPLGPLIKLGFSPAYSNPRANNQAHHAKACYAPDQALRVSSQRSFSPVCKILHLKREGKWTIFMV